jgi:hypothetical protein
VRRSRFGELIGRQLDLFAGEQGTLIRDVQEAQRAYDRAGREEAEERYADYLDLVETATDALVELRDNYASTLDEETAEEYEGEFNRAVRRRFPPFAIELDEP